jgi:ribosome-associated protein
MTSRKPARRAARPAAPSAQVSAAQAPNDKASIAKVTTDKATSASSATAKNPPQLKIVETALADMKAVDARVLDVRGMTDIADWMVVASGTSDRHVRSIADKVIAQTKAAGVRPFGVEGANEGEWVLVDLPDVMVHLMLPRVREFYALEQLWERPAPRAAAEPSGKPRRVAGKRAAPRRDGEPGAKPPRRRAPAAKRRPADAR